MIETKPICGGPAVVHPHLELNEISPGNIAS
jgi:hypothetical protein